MAYRILSFDGGGIYGILSTIVLDKICAEFPSLISRTQFLAGTSVGAMLCAGLSYGFSPLQLRTLFDKWSTTIFNQPTTERKFLSWLGITSKHDNKAFREMLEDTFGNAKLKDLDKKILIPAFHLCENKTYPPRWKAKFFHNFEGKDGDGETKVVDVLMYTTAAPLFLPSVDGYIDGGFVCNNPAMSAIAQTQDERSVIDKRPHLNEIRILSFGRSDSRSYLHGSRHDWGYLQWGLPLINLTYNNDEKVIDYQCSKILGHRYHRICIDIDEDMRFKLDDWKYVPNLSKLAEEIDISKALEWLEEEW